MKNSNNQAHFLAKNLHGLAPLEFTSSVRSCTERTDDVNSSGAIIFLSHDGYATHA